VQDLSGQGTVTTHQGVTHATRQRHSSTSWVTSFMSSSAVTVQDITGFTGRAHGPVDDAWDALRRDPVRAEVTSASTVAGCSSTQRQAGRTRA